MDIEKLADRLAYYNEWRRGLDGKQPHPVELGADIDEAVSALREIARLRAEVDALRVDAERYRKGLVAAEYLMNNSSGVYGMHLNGDCSPWDELRTGGMFEAWLLDFDAAIDAARGGK